MKREYRATDELGKQRSIDKFREMAKDGASVQLVLPLAEVMQMLRPIAARSWVAFDAVGNGRRSRASDWTPVISRMTGAVVIAGAMKLASVW